MIALKIKKKICLIALLLGIVILIACLGNVVIPKTILTSGEIKNKPLIIIDAGHGGLTNTID